MLHRSFSFVSACCIALAVLTASALQAAEFKPFLTLKTAGPSGLISVVESFSALFDPTDTGGTKAALAPYKNMRGINSNGTIGLAIAANEESPFGVDAIVILPVSDFKTFQIPEMEEPINMLRMMAQSAGANKYTVDAMFLKLVIYQKTGFVILATEGAADFAATADPKKLFAEIDSFTLGIHANLENISDETIEAILDAIAMPLAMSGMDIDEMFDMDEFMGNIENFLGEMSALTMGVTLDPKTMDLTTSVLTVPKKGSDTAKKFLNVKNAKTKLGAFAPDTQQTVFAWHLLEYMTESDIEQLTTFWETISESFMEGFLESFEDEEGGEKIVQAVELIVEYLTDMLDYYQENPLIDATVWLDSDGTLIGAEAVKDTKTYMDLDEGLFSSLLEIFDTEELFEDKIKRDYETIAGYSLSCVKNVFADLPDDVELPDEIKTIPLSVFWAVKENEAVVWAAGLDFAKAEKTLKDMLEKSATAAPPKQTAVFSVKPFGELFLNQVLPLVEKLGLAETAEEITQVKNAFTIFSKADTAAKAVITTTFPNDGQLQECKVNGKVFTTFFVELMKPAVGAAQEAAKRMQCSNNLKQIVLALHNYHDTFNAMPPLYTVDSNGNPLHSWRVLILPFIEQDALYRQIRLDEPWDSAHNKQFHNAVILGYSCPSNTAIKPGKACTYSAIAGQVLVPAKLAGQIVGNSFAAVTDGTSNTLAVVEVKEPFCWMDPTADVTLDELAKGINVGKVGSFHTGGCNAALFDGASRFISDTVAKEILRALGDPKDGKAVSL